MNLNIGPRSSWHGGNPNQDIAIEMTVKIQDILKVDVVLVGIGLLRTQQSLDAFLDSVGKEAVVEPLNVGPNIPVPGIRIAFNRDRISVVLSYGRSVIVQEYPDQSGLHQLADIVQTAINYTPASDEILVAVGFNIELVYDQESGMTASDYIADRLLSGDACKVGGWQLTAGANRTVIQANGPRITQSVAPRFNDASTTKLFVSLNLHTETNQIPDHSEIVASLRHAWKLVHDFPVRFDEDGTDG